MEKKVMMLKKLAKKIEHKLIVLLLLALIAMTACRDGWEPADAAPGDADAVRSTYTISGEGLKTRMSGSTFTPVDQIGIYMIPAQSAGAAADLANAYANRANVPYTFDDAGNLTPVLVPLTYPGTNPFNVVAYWPYCTTVTNYKIPVDVSVNATYPVPDMGLLYADGRGEAYGKGDEVDYNFKSAMCKLSILVKADEGYDLSMSGATLTIEGMPVRANFNLRTGQMENLAGTDTQVGLYLDPTDNKDKAQYETLLIPHTPANAAGKRVFTFTFDGGVEREWEVPDTTVFRAGTNYTLSFRVTKQDVEPANCYMVKPGTSITFPVKRAYIGDGTSNVLRVDGDEYTGAYQTKIIWADVSGLLTRPTTTLSNVSGTGPTAKVTVRTASGKTGNAVIGIFKTTDTDTPVWSYHIWVTDPDDIITYTNQYTYSGTEYKFTFMDRNLGATAAGLGSGLGTGLFYQWGRKDPFPATGAPGDAQAVGNFTATAVLNTTGTIVYTIKHPNIFIYQGSTSNSGDWHWDGRDNTLWGHNDVKSIYDPCPAGWRVPVNKNMSSNTSPWSSYSTNGGGSGGYKFGSSPYPACGRRLGNSQAGEAHRAGTHGYYWTASAFGVESDYGSGMAWNQKDIFIQGYYERAYGFSIRCVKES